MEFLGVDLRWRHDGTGYAVVFWENQKGTIKPTIYTDQAQIADFVLRARRERRAINVATKLDIAP